MACKPIFESYSVLQNISLPSAGVPLINDIEKENNPFPGYETIGGVLSDTELVWNANGPHFNLFNSKSGKNVASWNFGSVKNAVQIKISCVEELPRPTRRLPLLIIGLQCYGHGQICVLDVTGSRILRCVDIDHEVTSLSVIDPNYDISLLSKSLCIFDGIVAVGTSNGQVYLIDICQLSCEEVLDNTLEVRDELNACGIEILYPDELNNLQQFHASTNDKHLCIHLNAIGSNTEHFVLKGPKGDNRIFVNKAEVVVSALHYNSQLGSLLVGFNFGAWQLWNLVNLQLVYTSPVYEENIPVAHFAVQEPCDDPRAFCYVWAVYSNTGLYQSGLPVAVLYSLNYESKSLQKGYGVLYQNLTACAVRFQTVLSASDEDDVTNENEQIGANCLRLQAINKSFSLNSLHDSQDETITVCAMVWNSWNLKTTTECKTYLSLFDLNQWYKEQMPSFPNSNNCQTYMSRVCLSDILNSDDSALKFLDVRINVESLSQFLGTQRLEEHYWPSSLAFQTSALGTSYITIFENKGNQRALMSGLECGGQLTLLKPTDQFLQGINLGLTPLFIDVPTKTTSLDSQREFLLSIGLEQQLLGWLCKCVTAWSSGIYASAGCNLNFLISWGWRRAQTLKENADMFSVSLFDYSGLRLDANTHNLLNHCSRQLTNLSMLFKFVVRKFLGFVLNPDEVKDQSQCLEMISVHLEVLHWLLNVGLLPECPLTSYPRIDEFNRINAPYPAQPLIDYFTERRMDLTTLVKKKFSTSESLLFIDNLLEHECGGHRLQKQWEDDGGSGIYPPPSLQALMRTYLIENVEISYKHCVLVYFFLDLTMVLDANRYASTITHLIKFPSVFHLSPSVIKIIQSFWQLDHGDFNAAIEHILDPMVSGDDLKLWHHRVALKALLAQEEYNLALLYLQVRRPAVTEVNDLCTILSLYVANNMIDEAFHFQRQHQSFDIASRLLHHFYEECDKVGNIKSILFLPLKKEEEEAFIKYLKDVDHPQADDLQIYYYTQHSRYVDAVNINNHVNSVRIASRGLHGQQVLTDTDYIISRLAFMSNPLNKSIMDWCKGSEIKSKVEVTRPQPFSVFVHNTEEQIKYKSSLIEAGLLKAKETWSRPILNTKSSTKDKVNDVTNEDIPFLSIPMAKLSQSRVLTPLIYPKLTNASDENTGEPPSKKSKPLSRLTISTLDNPKQNSEVASKTLSARIDTPIIKRKLSRGLLFQTAHRSHTSTPQSILKSQTFNMENSFEDTENVHSDDTTNAKNDSYPLNIERRISSVRRSRSNLTPRRPLMETPKPAVRFSFSKSPSQSSQCSSETEFEIIEEKALVHSPLEGSSKNDVDNLDLISVISEPPKTPRSRRSYNERISTPGIRSSPRLHKLNESYCDYRFDVNVQELKESENTDIEVEIEPSATVTSPLPSRTLRSRRSYKDNLPEGKIKSSPRGKTKRTNDEAFKPLEKDSSLFGKPKFESRRSLSRMVLENNTFNTLVELSTSTISNISTFESTFPNKSQTAEESEQIVDVKAGQKAEKNSDKADSSFVFFPDNYHTEDDEAVEERINEDNEPKVPETHIIAPEAEEKPTVDESMVSNQAVLESEEDNKFLEEENEDEEDIVPMDVDKDSVNIYEDLSNDGNYESADPKMNVFEISDDLNLNEAICASNLNTLEVETNSNYSANGAAVFEDESEVLNVVPVEETTSDEPDTTMPNDPNETVFDDGISEIKDEGAVEVTYSSPSCVEVVELSSTSEEGNSAEDYVESDSSSSHDYSNSSPLSDIQEENLESSSSKESDDVIQLHVIPEEELELESILTESTGDIENEAVCTEGVPPPEVGNLTHHSDSNTAFEKKAVDVVNQTTSAEKKEDLEDSECTSTTYETAKSNLNSDERDKRIDKSNPFQRINIATESSKTAIIYKKIFDDSLDDSVSDIPTPSTARNFVKNVLFYKNVLCKMPMNTIFTDTSSMDESGTSEDSFDDLRKKRRRSELFNPLKIGNPESAPSISKNRNVTHDLSQGAGSSEMDLPHEKDLSATPTDQTKTNELNHSSSVDKPETSEDSFDELLKKRRASEFFNLLKTGNPESAPSISKNGNVTHDLNQGAGSSEMDLPHEKDLSAIPTDQSKTNELNDTSSFMPQHNDKLNNEVDEMKQQHTSTPARRSKRIFSLQNVQPLDISEIGKYGLRKRSCSISEANTSVECGPSIKTLSKAHKTTAYPIPAKRKRNLSTDNVQSPSIKRNVRATSVDVELLAAKPKTIQSENKKVSRIKSVKSNRSEDLNVELNKQSTHRKPKSAITTSNKTNIDHYANTRRLTRRQTNLLAKTLVTNKTDVSLHENVESSSDSEHSDHRGPEIPEISAINLLDKQSFDGKPDSDEELIHKSPVSSVASSPHLRSASSLSNTSPQPTSSKRKTIAKAIDFSNASSSKRIKGRSARAQSESKVVPKKTRKRRGSKESEASSISQTRSLHQSENLGRVTRRTRSEVEEPVQPSVRRSQRQKTGTKTDR